jgi:adenylosuccinate synthase
MMSCTVIVGTQFGDEGKGKIVDYYSDNVDIIVRYNGGANAGHTVVIGNEKFAFRLLPSGVLRSEKTVILGHGMAIDPEVLLSEITALREREVIPAQIIVSDRAHLVFPYHKVQDELEETLKNSLRAGTTKRGIGPCYSDKVGRFGVRICDLLDEKVLSEKLDTFIPLKEKIFSAYGSETNLEHQTLLTKYLTYGQKLRPYIDNALHTVYCAIQNNKRILLEGAQGTLLDVDYGVYPYGTSSNAVSGGACTGAGIPPNHITQIIGVVKAYTSRVGEGPFPTEIYGPLGETIRERGGEYGTVTKRPRRCGWLDLVMVNYSIRVNGVTSLALTKLDVLSGFEKLQICTAYDYRGTIIQQFPANTRILAESTPIYTQLPGWNDVTKTEWIHYIETGSNSLPSKIKQYIDFIEAQTTVPVDILSVGPERELTMWRDSRRDANADNTV